MIRIELDLTQTIILSITLFWLLYAIFSAGFSRGLTAEDRARKKREQRMRIHTK